METDLEHGTTVEYHGGITDMSRREEYEIHGENLGERRHECGSLQEVLVKNMKDDGRNDVRRN
jgi:hypothetical protein